MNSRVAKMLWKFAGRTKSVKVSKKEKKKILLKYDNLKRSWANTPHCDRPTLKKALAKAAKSAGYVPEPRKHTLPIVFDLGPRVNE